MTSIFTKPMFPLELVVFPEETLALHVFEERYKLLIVDILKDGTTLGIPTLIYSSLQHGTEVKIEKVVKEYENGSKDIVFKALRTFKIEKFYQNLDSKQYSGADVRFLNNIEDGTKAQIGGFIDLLRELYFLLNIPIPKIDMNTVTSFTYAHKIGLTLDQEYQLLLIEKESERLDFLKSHLNTSIPVLKQMSRAKEVARLNGHIKNFDPLDFSNLP